MTTARRPLHLTDEGFRDGPQSLWSSRMSTDTMVDAAPLVDRVGYEKSLVVSGATFESAVVHLREDPWARIDAVTRLMPHTPAAAQIRGRTLFGWQQFPDDVVELFVRTLARHGIRWLLIYDALNDMRQIEHHVRVAHSCGIEVTVPVCHTVSPVHTDDVQREVVRRAAALGVSRVSLLDASGLLSAESARALIGVAQEELAGSATRLEMNVHDLTGRAAECYDVALACGVDVLAGVPRAVSYGRSIPSVEDVVATADRHDRPLDVDRAAIAEVDAYFDWAAHVEGRPRPRSTRMTDAEIEAFTRHQIPGGMMSNLVAQLTALGVADRLGEILEEAARVRAELGHPVMVTPCSQMVGVQATLNVVSGERYASSPVELRNYLAGMYGRPAGKIAPDVLDRVLGDDPEIDPYERFARPFLPAFRDEHGAFDSDEDLLLAVLYSEAALAEFRREQVPTRTRPRRPETALVAELITRMAPRRLQVRL
ncbi:hypothetical protein GCM10009836_01630 [Pseudonocardia ailaonensis]|uniref:Pyruvate carboxyltransferase domain-containing protein n=1 Tax=Pseudonocardia ailaonensis TaxID=367279 RepID=A0ABN2MHV7_9PSEU